MMAIYHFIEKIIFFRLFHSFIINLIIIVILYSHFIINNNHYLNSNFKINLIIYNSIIIIIIKFKII